MESPGQKLKVVGENWPAEAVQLCAWICTLTQNIQIAHRTMVRIASLMVYWYVKKAS